MRGWGYQKDGHVKPLREPKKSIRGSLFILNKIILVILLTSL
jgi:hypothetical protein